MGKKKSASKRATPFNYKRFVKLDGHHPWMDLGEEGHIAYSVRQLPKGEVVYFNFDLAKEMGLISKNHPHKLNTDLKKTILETFNLRIINEYDIENKVEFPKDSIKPNKYMATRYLQLQHKNKQGKTSGDGRGIWNGLYSFRGTEWDVSSRGTGVTALAPGAVEAKEPLQSGNTDHGYGCGLAEIDELYSSAIMAEILHKKGYKTERMLAIIENDSGLGIGVRSGKNLFRPAHLFTYLKQQNLEALKKATDFFIQRQNQNGVYNFNLKSKNKYQKLLEEVCYSYSEFVAHLERDYIFAWLDWDGDNVLADAGIIDYGSIRQLGLRHDSYRYDDVERFSTTLNEQRAKGRLIVQVFAQLVDYLEVGIKKPLKDFENHPILNKFDNSCDYHLLDRLLYQIGFDRSHREVLLQKRRTLVETFYQSFLNLEKHKAKETIKLEDGLNRPALINMKVATRLLAESVHVVEKDFVFQFLEDQDFALKIYSEEARESGIEPSKTVLAYVDQLKGEFQQLFVESFKLHPEVSKKKYSKNLKERAYNLNDPKRITGNALIFIVDEIINQRNEGYGQPQIQQIIDDVIHEQYQDPDRPSRQKGSLPASASKKLMKTILTIVDGHKEDV